MTLIHRRLIIRTFVTLRKVVNALTSGIVKWFDTKKGYGFIQYDDQEEIFVHFTAIEEDGFRELKAEQPVLFKIVEGPRGLQAAHVQKIEK